ncbi:MULTISPECIES: class I SAM-dependent methyltransferase [unclassified Prochlorococcus]|uniref:class I SAM-dependent methyltransferase n=1 Tax=unclassified Prochlorococcus TaxID=2627481 RepID=UPI0005339D6B|nr:MULTISPECIES: methyltransferase domain-containing protein [unclassified Prochlorococcus]KGG16211.1 SAM-dependent methyltransferase [Prochlorococcus sp. MIT 0603]KGG18054.1 SAM-dependent methyltransferase [Prochlorococcus sp. MIT 0602]
MHNLELDVGHFIESGFDLKEHLAQYLNLSVAELEESLSVGLEKMSSFHPGSFNADDITGFYENEIGNAHLFDLASWHLKSSNYIADTIRLEKMFAHGNVLDFGGGIGTHALAATAIKSVDHVFFVDLNPQNREFVAHRAQILGVNELISVHRDLESIPGIKFDTVICLDVLEHLPNPSEQLLTFHDLLSDNSIALLNWYFYKGANGEYPFHFDEKEMIEKFFLALQNNFLEMFHPFLITARSYKPIRNK